MKRLIHPDLTKDSAFNRAPLSPTLDVSWPTTQITTAALQHWAERLIAISVQPEVGMALAGQIQDVAYGMESAIRISQGMEK